MKIVFDTNIILDVLLAREPYLKHSKLIIDEVEKKNIQGVLCATTITTINYFLVKSGNRESAKIAIEKLLSLFRIAKVNKRVIEEALLLDFSDFEDAVLYQSGILIKADAFVTRNVKDFKMALLPVYSPADLLAILPSFQSSSGGARRI